MIEYRDWAKGQLSADHVPSPYDWENMSLAEMANRALAICKEARNDSVGDLIPGIWAFQCLEAMAKQLKERYPPKRPEELVMAKWTVINIDKDLRTEQITGGTYAMKIPGGMLVRVVSQLGESLTFVPIENPMTIDIWIEENKIDK